MTFLQRGFTLVEILIVIALIGIFAAATTYLMDDVRIEQTNSERLANNINDSLKNARNNMIVGKGVYTGGVLYPAEKRTISIDPSGISTTYSYNNGTSTGTESVLQWPFFDNDTRYQITDISVSSGRIINSQKIGWDHTGVTTADITMLPEGDISIIAIKGGSIISSQINTIRVTAGYAGMERSVILDRFIGSTEVIKGREGVDIGLIDPPINGVCDNGTVSSCIAGTATGTITVACGSPTTWSCEGAYGGTTDATCNYANPACPVNCVGSWGICSGGSQTYTITTPASGGGTACVAANAAIQSCGTPASVTAWSVCSAGTQSRTCTEATGGGTPTCTSLGATPGLNTQSCGVNCVAAWNNTSTCSVSCGGGTLQQVYTITTPASGGGVACTDANGATRWGSTSCNTASCAVNCSYTTYQGGSCSASCGGGNYAMYYTKTVVESGGGSCPIVEGQFAGYSGGSCNTQACTTSGPYSYGSWGSCTGPCGTNNGTRSRTESCNYDSCYSPQSTTQSCTASACACVPNGSCSAPAPACGSTTYGTDNCGNSCSLSGPACACVPNGSCSAPAPTCGSTTYGTDNCGNSCSLSGPACAVNCSYTTYQGGSCSASCGGGNYAMYYTKTAVESGGGSCPIVEGQFAGYSGGSCNTQACASASCTVEKCINYGPDIGQCGGGGGSEFDCQCQAYQNETLAHGASTTLANPNLFVGTVDCGGYVWDTGWACELNYSTVICDNGTIIY